MLFTRASYYLKKIVFCCYFVSYIWRVYNFYDCCCCYCICANDWWSVSMLSDCFVMNCCCSIILLLTLSLKVYISSLAALSWPYNCDISSFNFYTSSANIVFPCYNTLFCSCKTFICLVLYSISTSLLINSSYSLFSAVYKLENLFIYDILLLISSCNCSFICLSWLFYPSRDDVRRWYDRIFSFSYSIMFSMFYTPTVFSSFVWIGDFCLYWSFDLSNNFSFA